MGNKLGGRAVVSQGQALLTLLRNILHTLAESPDLVQGDANVPSQAPPATPDVAPKPPKPSIRSCAWSTALHNATGPGPEPLKPGSRNGRTGRHARLADAS